MKIITFGSIKGGTGKTSSLILVARAIAKSGKKVLLLDLDINNSLSFSFIPDSIEEQDKLGNKHIAAALQASSLDQFIIHTDYKNIDLIQSSLYLVDFRTISTNRLKNLFANSNLNYDYVFIDTAPTYDNIALMSYEASDLIVTPILLSQFDFNTSLFLSGKLQTETSAFNKWYLMFNCVKPESKTQDEYIELFSSTFKNIFSSSIPNSTQVRNCIDRRELLGNSKVAQKLRNAILSVASEITEENISFTEAF